MEIKPLDDRLFVTAQPRLDELEQLAEQGFRTIISNRPRGESDDQPDPDALKAKAESLGMVWHEVPISELVGAAKSAGYDLEPLRESLENQANDN